MEKLLLSGHPRSGKSTLLQYHLQGLDLRGFAMQRLTKNGLTWAFRLLDLADESYISQLESADNWPDIAISRGPEGKWHGNLHVFEGKGRRAIEKCREGNIAVFDELGINEEKAWSFQQAVFNVLERDIPLLGIIKAKSSPFLDKVRAHPNLKIIPYPSNEAIAAVAKFVSNYKS